MTAEDLYDGSTLYESTLKSTTDDTSVGMMNFSKKKSKIWLYKIEINEEYHNLGLGTKMMRFLDYMANKTRCNSIEGKYYPSVNYGEHFYKKNGYSIEKEGYVPLKNDKKSDFLQKIYKKTIKYVNYRQKIWIETIHIFYQNLLGITYHD